MKKKTAWQLLFDKDKLNICIIGGGSIGMLLAMDFGRWDNIEISILTSKPEKWNSNIKSYNRESILLKEVNINTISDNPQNTISCADIIISTVPSNAFLKIFNQIKSYIKKESWFGVMPGTGGCELYSKEIIDQGITFFGFQRVHGVARVKEYGREVYDLGKREELYISALPHYKAQDVCDVMEELLDIYCTALPNYLNVTLTPSNPILHTVRLYDLFKDYQEGYYYDKPILFYKEWTLRASELLIEADEEVQTICKRIKLLDLSYVKSLKEHYESKNADAMLDKIKSIPAFQNIETPMINVQSKYIPDFESRYFQEDFPFGLCIIKSFAKVTGVETPVIDIVLKWFEKTGEHEFFIDNKFTGNSLKGLPILENFDIKSVSDIIKFYSR